MTRVRILFGSVVFLASFLLFLVEPIAAKQLLPVLGGSAAVWITCLVFFQTALLCAYLYAHWLARRALWFVHFALLAIASAIGDCVGRAKHCSWGRPCSSIHHDLRCAHSLYWTALPGAWRHEPADAGLVVEASSCRYSLSTICAF